MRFKSEVAGGFQVFAVSGINTVSFGIKASPKARRGLLGFAVERDDPAERESYPMPGFKVFTSVVPNPDETTRVSTLDHPIQSFVWDDFTAKPDREYTYRFRPLRGTPDDLDRSAPPLSITIHTEALFSDSESDVFFNRGVDVKIIIDAKVNAKPPEKPFPRHEDFETIRSAGIEEDRVTLREAKASNIQHNKFIVLVRKGKAREVWTGSTNLSVGGFHGQTNVGHWLRNEKVADRFLAYWDVLSKDPGARAGDDRATANRKNAELAAAVEAINQVPVSIKAIKKGVTPVFSPRRGSTMRDLYYSLVDEASKSACITLAFGVGDDLKKKLRDNTAEDHIVFLLLEKRDQARPNAKNPFVALNAQNNVYSAWGSFLRDPLYQWAKETNAQILELNNHVSYVHSNFLIKDPLGETPIVVTGSANFSKASTNSNDENMLIIKGDRRVADIYFTEFNRLFNHYYFRAVHEATTKAGRGDGGASLFLVEDDSWTQKYEPGKLKQKRLDLYTGMRGFAEA